MVHKIEIAPVAGGIATSVVDFRGLGITDAMLPRLLEIDAVKKVYPWEAVADWTHKLPVSPTEQWMDALGRDQFFHRWKGHHLISDGWKVLNDTNKSLPDFLIGLSKDVITIHGVPLLSDSTVTLLSKSLGVSVHKIMPWVLNNAFDLTIGVAAGAEAGHDLFLAFTGQMEWGLRTAFFTFGTGSAEILAGLQTEQPLLVMAGIGEYGAGIRCAWDYYTQPFFFGVSFSELLTGMGVGAIAGLACSVVTMGFIVPTTSPSEKAIIALRSTGIGAVLGLLSAISPWVSIPVGLGWTAGNLAVKLAHQKNLSADFYKLSSPWARKRSFEEALQTCGPEKALATLKYATEAGSLDPYKAFLEKHQGKFKMPTLNSRAKSYVNSKRKGEIS
jgi:hypothetical protein